MTSPSRSRNMPSQKSSIAEIIKKNEKTILQDWLELQVKTIRTDLISKDQLRAQSVKFFEVFVAACLQGAMDTIDGKEWNSVKEVLCDISRESARRGFNPSQTATFIFSLKQPLFNLIYNEGAKESFVWELTFLLDRLGLFTIETFQKSREELINRQQQEMLELSTPVVSLWDGVLALPLIGTLDSARTQVVMESLLEEIVNTGATIAIIDITGVPTVDTLVAQHLLKTVAAARLMGADCIISGIRPQIAQTIVHLGVELNNVITKATLADAFLIALDRLNYAIVSRSQA